MQALSNSNALPAKTPVSGVASLLSPAPQQWSPFAAILRAKLPAGNDAAKLPAGRAKDSARAQDVASTTLSFPGAALQLSVPAVGLAVPAAQPLSDPANATVVDSVPNHNPVSAIASSQLPASADAQSLTAAPFIRINVPMVANIPTVDPKLITHIADTAPNHYAPSNLPS